ncbi:MAG: hypothetical protein JWR11_6192 [Mycobacterium sp.]|nr:hypothetical protein [Mycobacterium sp.]
MPKAIPAIVALVLSAAKPITVSSNPPSAVKNELAPARRDVSPSTEVRRSWLAGVNSIIATSRMTPIFWSYLYTK